MSVWTSWWGRPMAESAVVAIEGKAIEARDIVTLRFTWRRECDPGQFIMVWIPEVDEVPMSLSYTGDRKGITVRKVGEATAALCSLSEGDLIGVRGPYGRGFSLSDGRTLAVAGGVGTASLAPLVESSQGAVDVALGARSADLLLFERRMSESSRRLRVSTDDGSRGFKGTVVELASEMMNATRYEHVVACGPERMLMALKELCEERHVRYQFSLERLMKCGVGLCGSCAVDGMRVCADGPVFTGDKLRKMMEFGRWKRDPSGQRVSL